MATRCRCGGINKATQKQGVVDPDIGCYLGDLVVHEGHPKLSGQVQLEGCREQLDQLRLVSIHGSHQENPRRTAALQILASVHPSVKYCRLRYHGRTYASVRRRAVPAKEPSKAPSS